MEPTTMLTTLLVIIPAYLIGAIPTGVILTKLSGAEDIRKVGSGNIGATNVYRTAGRKLGILTLIGDVLKGALPVLAVSLSGQFTDEIVAMTAVAAFVGHCYPIYLRFQGGKGVATALGIFLVLAPLSVLVGFFVFVGLLLAFKYISLSSISAAATVPIVVILTGANTPLVAASLFMAAMMILRHRSNIERLIKGQEPKFKS